MSLLAVLPTPKHQHGPAAAAPMPSQPTASQALTVVGGREPPPYPRRKGFVPRRQDDFKDGGAYPELPLLQYPLDMGRPEEQRGKQTLAVAVDIEGNANYDAIVRQGARANKVIHTGHQALIPKVDLLDPQNLQRPDEEEIARVAKETQEALSRRVNNKLAVQNPSTLPGQPGAPTYIKYTPSQQGPQYASGAKQRIIKLQDMPVDPLEPPKFRHTKVPRGTGSPPVPVMHSPPRPVTAEDQANWKIPPCISNWKNAKGYTIPLDKRLAADGRGLQEQTISDKFAGLSEALQVAESKAREATEMRKQVALEVARRQKMAKDEQLRKLAQQARMERGGPLAAAAAAGGGGLAGRDTAAAGAAAAAAAQLGGYPGPPPVAPAGGGHSPSSSSDDERRHGGSRRDSRRDEYQDRGGRRERRDEFEETAQEREERRRRDEIREERRRERERERRLEARDGHGPAKKSKTTRDRERDVSEKIALGMANVGATGEVQYDTRLFNQEQGMSSGFGAEDSYTMYDKPLFATRDSNLFKPVRGQDDELYGGGDRDGGVRTDRFKADRGFSGAAGDADGGSKRGGGVEYEAAGTEADPFGLEQFMEKVDRGKRPLDSIGQRGGMAAGAGGGGYEGGSGSRRMEFTSGSGRR